jgi:hypothetical protein
MKKEFIIILVIMLVILPLIQGIELPGKELIEKTTQIPNLAKNNSNNFLENEIILAEKSDILSKFILGVNNYESPTYMTILILIVLTQLMCLILLKNILEISPSFKSPLSILTSLVLTGVLSLLGVFNSFTTNLMIFLNNITILDKINIGILKTVIALLLIMFVFLILNLIIGTIKETIIKQKSVSDGLKVGAQLATLRAMADIENSTRGI